MDMAHREKEDGARHRQTDRLVLSLMRSIEWLDMAVIICMVVHAYINHVIREIHSALFAWL